MALSIEAITLSYMPQPTWLGLNSVPVVLAETAGSITDGENKHQRRYAARAGSSGDGASLPSEYRSARYMPIAAVSVTTRSPSVRMGTLPMGLSATIAGAFCAPFMMSTKRSSYGTPISSRGQTTFAARENG